MRYLLALGMISLLSCGKVQQEDTREIRAEIEAKKIKRITDRDLLAQATVMGEAMEKKFNADFKVECQSTYNIDGLAVEFFNKDFTVEGKDAKAQLQEAYNYALLNQQRVGANIQKLNDTLFIYSFPLKGTSYMKSACQADYVFVLLPTSHIVRNLP
jgi:hypothetical protein